MPAIFQRISHAFNGAHGRGADAAKPDEGVALHAELERWTSALAPTLLAPAGVRSPEHLNHETLLDKALPHASRLSDGTVLMASPHLDEALRFAYVCVEHRIDRVVDLRSAKEKQHGHGGPLDGGKSDFVKDHGIARFARQGRERPLNGAGKGDGKDHVRTVEVSLKPGRKTPAPAGGRPRDLSRSLEWIRVHAGSGKAVAPEHLLDVSLHLARTAPDGRTAFQCADGQHTGATFAAAHALLQAHLRDPMSAQELKEALLDECLSIRRDRGPELFRAEDLASLMAFGRLMLDCDRRGALRDLPRPGTPTVVPAGPIGPATPATERPRLPLRPEHLPLPAQSLLLPAQSLPVPEESLPVPEESLPLPEEFPPPLQESASLPPTTRAVPPQTPATVQRPLRKPPQASDLKRFEQGPTLVMPAAAQLDIRSILKKEGQASSRGKRSVLFGKPDETRRFNKFLSIANDPGFKAAKAGRAGPAAGADADARPKLTAYERLFGEPPPPTTDP
ncbi:hypothetical protein CDL60_12210 [Roseateles noduli]|nr:hypothetical protein CDL60_12210 [Roseateles noduli]